ncbi:hypothetical protein FRB94_007542 [Tulasnella sp. JGI-2019a]|nr:hypothetical protein FRB94_007542 [Tulasnella sp. JGI-2019a]KAG9028881.1 hypothetical protein FRB95_005931 [Tulasnella sp. JGI-2019a]
MKVLTSEELEGFNKTVLKGGLKGAAYGLGVSLPAAFILNRRWHYYRALPPNLKALSIIMVAVPWSVIEAERQSLRFEHDQWKTRAGYVDPHLNEERAQEMRALRGTKSETLDWIESHKWGIVGASWAGSMGAAFGIIMRDPFQTTAQKVVQARIWAQGLTIGLIMAAAGLTQLRGNDSVERQIHHVDHSWRMQVPELRREDMLAFQQAEADQRVTTSS